MCDMGKCVNCLCYTCARNKDRNLSKTRSESESRDCECDCLPFTVSEPSVISCCVKYVKDKSEH